MSDLSQASNVQISLEPCGDAGDCVKIRVAGEPPLELRLSPQQARALASDLIQTVYRAEVKQSLQRGKGSDPLHALQNGASHLGTQHAA